MPQPEGPALPSAAARDADEPVAPTGLNATGESDAAAAPRDTDESVAPPPAAGYASFRSEPLTFPPPTGPNDRRPPETPATLDDLEETEHRLRNSFERAWAEETAHTRKAVVSEVRTLVAESEERTRTFVVQTVRESEERTRAFVVQTVRESEARTKTLITESEARMRAFVAQAIHEAAQRQDDRLETRLAAHLTEVRALIQASEERTNQRTKEILADAISRMERIDRRFNILFGTLVAAVVGAVLTVAGAWIASLF